jgi:hypothetical protein
VCNGGGWGRGEWGLRGPAGVLVHALKEAGKGVPVVKHEVSHAEKGDLLKPAGTGAAAEGAISDALKGIVVVPAGRQGRRW